MAMSLESVSRGKRLRAPKIVVYGGIKLGKSTLGSEMENPIFIPTEEGIDALDVAAFPVAKSYSEVVEALTTLATEEHDYKSVIFDSIDWLEPLIWAHICAEHKVASIELVGGGYGKGYNEAAKVWTDFLAALDYLRNERGMSVLLIAHDIVRTMNPPDGEPYSYSTLKLNDKAVGKVTEWADIIGAITEKRYMRKTEQGFGKEHVRAMKAGERILIVGKDPAYVTGNRFSLPDEIKLPPGGSWNAVLDALAAAVSTPVKQAT